jgi:hypothetical protein
LLCCCHLQATAANAKLPPPPQPRYHCRQESSSAEERDGVFLLDVIDVQPLKITVVWTLVM